MSALGHKQTFTHLRPMSALPLKADIRVRRSERTASDLQLNRSGVSSFSPRKHAMRRSPENAFARPVPNSYIVMSCPKEIEGVGQCVIKALYLIMGLGA
jgi:hypothetical protein